MKTFWEMTHEERAELAQSDPQAFEDLYNAELTPVEQWHMKGLQSKLNGYKNPIARMNQAGTMMMEKFQELNESLKRFKK